MLFKNDKIIGKIYYSFSIFPITFIISILTFYIHGYYILGYWNISTINPNDMYLYTFYKSITIVSFLATFLAFFIWFLFLPIYFFKNKGKNIDKSIKFTTAFYLFAIILLFSNVFRFSMD